MRISVSELKTNAGKYVAMAGEQDIFITKNGKEIAKLTGVTKDRVASMKDLFGILPTTATIEEAREERLKHHGSTD